VNKKNINRYNDKIPYYIKVRGFFIQFRHVTCQYGSRARTTTLEEYLIKVKEWNEGRKKNRKVKQLQKKHIQVRKPQWIKFRAVYKSHR